MSHDQKKAFIDPSSTELSLFQQCDVLDIARSGLYYDPALASDDEISLKRNVFVLDFCCSSQYYSLYIELILSFPPISLEGSSSSTQDSEIPGRWIGASRT